MLKIKDKYNENKIWEITEIKNNKYEVVQKVNNYITGKAVMTKEELFKFTPVKQEELNNKIEEVIKRIFNEHFTNYDNYERSDVSCNMASEIIEELNLSADDLHIEKLSRERKEFITDFDYRRKSITTEYIINYYEIQAITEVIVDILDYLAENKSVSRKIKKWFKEC